MPIINSDIVYRLSGGGVNTNPLLSIGGEMSTVAGGIIATATLHTLFDAVDGPESAAGDIEYRLLYVVNNHLSLALADARLYFYGLTDSVHTELAYALDPAVVGAPSTMTISDENTAPAGLTWQTPTTYAAAPSIGSMPAQSFKAFWLRRTVSGGAASAAPDKGYLRLRGVSPA